METTYLHEYVCVARLGSFTAAAGELHLTQSTLSKHIAVLEREYGVDLFVRERSGVRLTEAGRVLYAQAVKLERVLAQTRALLQAVPSGVVSDMGVAWDVRRNTELRCKCRRAAEKFGLTDREAGALVLYLEERGFDGIQEELGVGRDDVAEVLVGAYRKLGAEGKQDALDLIHSISE